MMVYLFIAGIHYVNFMARKRIILWFRQDLRVHDNEALHEALQIDAEIYPVYVFDERVFRGETRFGFKKTGIHRARFILESVNDLKSKLQKFGSDLIIRIGRPEEEIPAIARQLKTSWIFCNRERTSEEVYVQDTLEQNLWSIGQEVRYSRGKMLYYTADLPFPITHTPDAFATFRKEVEKLVPVRDPLSTPEVGLQARFDQLDMGEVPTLSELLQVQIDHESIPNVSHIRGGETQGLIRLDDFLSDEISGDREITYNVDEIHFNSLLSAYLAQGCLSPKHVYHQVGQLAQNRRLAPLFQQIFQRLMYRDYLRLIGKKYGDRIFDRSGTHQKERMNWVEGGQAFDQWKNGETGIPLIDAIMHQLQATGLITHTSRKLAASYLVKELNVDWRFGASWFESHLIDYDPCSNWVNWMNIAGVGPNSKDDRKWNYELQTKRLDPEGTFVEKWAAMNS